MVTLVEGPTAAEPGASAAAPGADLTRALDVLVPGQALLVVQALLRGPMRHGDLVTALPGVRADALASSIAVLEAAGVLCSTDGASSADVVHELTDLGHRLAPAITALTTWGARRPRQPERPDTGEEHRSQEPR